MKQYPEQSPYVKGNKVWLNLDNDQELIISPQARKILECYKIDEQRFIDQLKEMLKLFTNVGHGMSFHRISVRKTSIQDIGPYIQINLYDIHGEALSTQK